MRSLPDLEDDQRIRRLLNDFDKRYTGQDFSSSQNKSGGVTITPDMLDAVCASLEMCRYLLEFSTNL